MSELSMCDYKRDRLQPPFGVSYFEYKHLKEENEKLKAENQQLSGISGQLKAENEQLAQKIENQKNEITIFIRKYRVEHALRIQMEEFWRKEYEQLKAQLQNYTELDLLSKFRLGDRVAVHRDGRDTFRGTIFNIVNGKLSVIEDGFYSAHDDSPFLPSQCRKLKKVKGKRFTIKLENYFDKNPVCPLCNTEVKDDNHSCFNGFFSDKKNDNPQYCEHSGAELGMAIKNRRESCFYCEGKRKTCIASHGEGFLYD